MTKEKKSYKIHHDLKKLMKEANLKTRDFMNILGISPSGLSQRLNGYSPMPQVDEEKIRRLCKSQIERLKVFKQEQEEEAKLITKPRSFRRLQPTKSLRQITDEIRQNYRNGLKDSEDLSDE